MSFTQWFTRSRPTVLCTEVMKAILSLVPTPSAEATRTGSLRFGKAPSNMPPKLPMSESVRWLKVVRASSLILSVALVAASISTPASLYVKGLDMICVLYLVLGALSLVLCFMYWRLCFEIVPGRPRTKYKVQSSKLRSQIQDLRSQPLLPFLNFLLLWWRAKITIGN